MLGIEAKIAAATSALVIATGGLLVNLGSVYVLQGGEMSLNERGAFYHLLGDAGGSVAVIASTLVIEVTGVTIIDPIVAGLIALLITWSAGKVLYESGEIFLQKTPFEQRKVRTGLREIDGGTAIDDLHAWQICSHITVATTHLETGVESMAEVETVTRCAHDVLADHDVDHATVELFPRDNNRDAYLNECCH